jgi:alkyl hydroperoxide reductase subunit AhpF
MSRPVRLLFFTQTFGCETCAQVRQILDELPALSDKITIEEVNFVLQPDQASLYGIDRAPAIAVVGRDEAGSERDSKIRFVGAPAGYEFISLIHAIRLVGSGHSHLSERNRVFVASVDKPLVMRVFTTPT